MNKSLKEILENVYVSSKELKENNESTQFKEIATHILSGHFEIKKNNSVFKVYPTCVEIYCHEENENGVKDYIVYHRNTPQSIKPLFPIGILNNHQSGIDITFEKCENKCIDNAVRLSALIREIQIEDTEDNTDQYQMFINYKNKKEWKEYKIISGPLALYDALYSRFSIFDGGFSIQWVDDKLRDIDEIESDVRINVAQYENQNGRMVKMECKESNQRPIASGKYCQDPRMWKYSIKKEYLPIKKKITDSICNSVYFSEWLKSDYPEIYKGLSDILKRNDIAYDTIPETKDIWCRDYMPIQTDDDEYICYRYRPDYLLKRKSDARYITDNIKVCDRMNIKALNEKINIDGGNIVKAGNKIIMTEKVFAENAHIEKSQLIQKLQTQMRSEIIFLPWDKNEVYGHADGIVKPISDDTVLMTNYDDFDIDFYNECKRRLSAHFKVETLRYNVRHKDKRNWVYINFLTVGQLIIVPQINIEEDAQAVKQLRQFYPNHQIELLNIEPIVAAGGGLNCITWCRKIDYNEKRFLKLFNRFESEKDKEIDYTKDEIILMCKHNLCKFADKYSGIAEYYMKCLDD